MKASIDRTSYSGWLIAITTTITMAIVFVGIPRGALPAEFIRGDVNSNGVVDINDAVLVLRHAFLNGPSALACLDAADVADEGHVSVSSVVYSLRFLILGDNRPPSPYPTCGADPTPDRLSCDTSSVCEDDVSSLPRTLKGDGLSITNFEPNEVDARSAPVTVEISGRGFRRDDLVRLYYPTERDLVMEIAPSTVTDDTLVVEIGTDWFDQLASASDEREAQPGQESGPTVFFVKIVQSNRTVVGRHGRRCQAIRHASQPGLARRDPEAGRRRPAPRRRHGTTHLEWPG